MRLGNVIEIGLLLLLLLRIVHMQGKYIPRDTRNSGGIFTFML